MPRGLLAEESFRNQGLNAWSLLGGGKVLGDLAKHLAAQASQLVLMVQMPCWGLLGPSRAQCLTAGEVPAQHIQQ